MLTAYYIIIDGIMNHPLLCKGNYSAAAVRATDGRQTTGMAVVERRVRQPSNHEQIKRKGIAIRQFPFIIRIKPLCYRVEINIEV